MTARITAAEHVLATQRAGRPKASEAIRWGLLASGHSAAAWPRVAAGASGWLLVRSRYSGVRAGGERDDAMPCSLQPRDAPRLPFADGVFFQLQAALGTRARTPHQRPGKAPRRLAPRLEAALEALRRTQVFTTASDGQR